VAADAVPNGGAIVVPVGGALTVAIFRVGEAFYALDNACPHRGGPLGQGSVEGMVVTCPWHGFTVDLRTGCCPRNPLLRVRIFVVSREGETVRVVIPVGP
jgi:nitrite reductase (NADH) small subunit/3-phenylpropionate/trans-cinnamate dioxygenase ferredoxin subunit